MGRHKIPDWFESRALPPKMLAIDPSLRGTGYAYFVAGELRRAGLARSKEIKRIDAAHEVIRQLQCEFLDAVFDLLVVEVPQIYQTSNSPIDANDLISVALVAGGTAAISSMRRIEVLPHAWKGSVSKAVIRYRVRKALSPEEISLIECCDAGALAHNIYDAAGIGLWYLKRAKKRA